MYALHTFLLILYACARQLSNSFNDELNAYTHIRAFIDLRTINSKVSFEN